MARLYQGLDGAISGRLGTMVGYVWKNRACVRAYRKVINYPNTKGQQQEREWFVSMVRFASQGKAALQLGFKKQATETGMTEGNYFVCRNKMHFHRVEEGVEVDYCNLVLAEGAAADVLFHTPEFGEGETVSIDFEKNMLFSRSSGEDQIYVYAYSSDFGEGYLAAPVLRRSKRINIQLPESWAGTVVHLYGFVVDREGRASNSTYIGVGKVNHYNERGVYIPVNKSWDDFVELAKHTNDETPADALNSEEINHVDIFSLAFEAPPD